MNAELLREFVVACEAAVEALGAASKNGLSETLFVVERRITKATNDTLMALADRDDVEDLIEALLALCEQIQVVQTIAAVAYCKHNDRAHSDWVAAVEFDVNMDKAIAAVRERIRADMVYFTARAQ